MTWQEKLRRLDSDLAAGTISRNEHRRRREDILAEASGAPPVAPVTSATPATAPSADGDTSPGTDGAGSPGSTALAPGWQAANPAAQQAIAQQAAAQEAAAQELTAQAPRDRSDPSALLATERPTTAPSPADERPTETIRYADFGVPPPTGWHSARNRAGDGTPPGPLAPDDPPRRGGLAWVAITMAVLVALGAVIGGAWWLGQDSTTARDTNEQSSDPGGAAGDAPGDTGPALADRLPTLPGQPNPDNSTLAVDKGVELGLYPQVSADILAENGVREVIYRASSDGETGYFLLVIPTSGTDKARAVAQRMRELTQEAGFEPIPDMEHGLTGRIDDRRLRGTWYVSGETTVNLWVSQPTAAGTGELTSLAKATVAELHRALPPA